MRKLLCSLSGITVLFFLFWLQVGVSSCTKEVIQRDTVTVTKLDTLIQEKKDTIVKTDTIVIKDTALSMEILTANSWKVQEIRGVQENSILYYLRGGTANTESFDNEYITFNADKTGIYYDDNRYTHQITWDFSNNANTKLTFVVQNPAPLASHTVVYENLRYKNKALLFDQYWTYNNINTHAQVIRIPK